jgi:hypothetical protein
MFRMELCQIGVRAADGIVAIIFTVTVNPPVVVAPRFTG